MNALKDFLREFWLWILIPGLLVVVGLLVLLFLTGSEGSSPFVYNLM